MKDLNEKALLDAKKNRRKILLFGEKIVNFATRNNRFILRLSKNLRMSYLRAVSIAFFRLA